MPALANLTPSGKERPLASSTMRWDTPSTFRIGTIRNSVTSIRTAATCALLIVFCLTLTLTLTVNFNLNLYTLTRICEPSFKTLTPTR